MIWSRISAGMRCSPWRSIQGCRRGSLQSSNLLLPPPWTRPSPPASSSACGLRGTAPTAALPGPHGAAAPPGCSQCTSPPAWGNLELQPGRGGVIRERVWQAPLTQRYSIQFSSKTYWHVQHVSPDLQQRNMWQVIKSSPAYATLCSIVAWWYNTSPLGWMWRIKLKARLYVLCPPPIYWK